MYIDLHHNIHRNCDDMHRKCPRCTFDNDIRAKKCEMCNHAFSVKIRVSILFKESTKLVRSPYDLQILMTLDRLFVEASNRCNMRGQSPGRIHLHLPKEIHISALPPQISLLPQPITCNVNVMHDNVELGCKIFANPKDIARLIPNEVKIVLRPPKVPQFRLLHLVARPGALQDPEVTALGINSLRSIDSILVNASKHCSIRGAGRKQSFSFPLKLHPPNGICVEFEGESSGNSTNTNTQQVLRLRVRHTHNTMIARIRVNLRRFKRIFRDNFLHIHDEDWNKSKTAAPKHVIEKIKKESFVMDEAEVEKRPEEKCEVDMCCVCHENMVPGNRVANFGCPSNHKFHLECILPWLERNSKCPLCRFDLREKK